MNHDKKEQLKTSLLVSAVSLSTKKKTVILKNVILLTDPCQSLTSGIGRGCESTRKLQETEDWEGGLLPFTPSSSHHGSYQRPLTDVFDMNH